MGVSANRNEFGLQVCFDSPRAALSHSTAEVDPMLYHRLMNLALPIAATLVALSMATPNLAEACACCDGGNTREVVGWSASGQSALVSNRGKRCQDTLSFEIMRAGRDEPIACFDGYSETPSRRIACSDLADGFERFGDNDDARPTTSPRAREYPVAPEQIAASHVYATLEDAPGSPEHGNERHRLRVFVLVGDQWRPLFERTLFLGAPEGQMEEDMSDLELAVMQGPQAIKVRVWPNPSGERALVEVSGHNESPSMGEFPDDMAWVRLPSTTLPRVTPGAPGIALAVRIMNDSTLAQLPRQAARIINGQGLRYHRQQQYLAAAEQFATALLVNPAHVVARYNLACALALLGHLEPAFAILETIAESDCARCAERMERALVDDDLAALRPRMRALRSP